MPARSAPRAVAAPMPDAPTALCPACGVPLICTFAFSGHEFYCLDCGGLFDWLDPVPGNAVEHEADHAARLTLSPRDRRP